MRTPITFSTCQESCDKCDRFAGGPAHQEEAKPFSAVLQIAKTSMQAWQAGPTWATHLSKWN